MRKLKFDYMNRVLVILFLIFLIYLVNVYSQKGVGISLKIVPADITSPKINITKFEPTSARNITINGSYGDDNDIANITLELNSSYKVPADINKVSKTWNTTINLTEGWNKFYVLAYDKAGNLANVSSWSQGASILSDTTKPAINITSTQNMSSVANNSLITFKITDLSLADAFYAINDGTTKSFNSIYEIRVGTSDWVNGVNYVIVNATDSTNNVETKNFTFMYTNIYSIVLNSSINVVIAELNQTNTTINNFKDAASLQSLVNNFAAQISIQDYNKTLQILNVTANISNAVSSMQTLLQDILSANSSSQDNATKIATINDKLNEISNIKNTTISSVDVNLFNTNLSIQVETNTIDNVTKALITAAGGLSAADENSFKQASATLQNKTTILNKVQVLTQTFLSGRTENVTLFQKNITINETQSGQFYVNEIIDKNITGSNDLNANTDIENRASQPMTVVVADPTVSWAFSDSSSAEVSYAINAGVSADNVGGAQTVVTTIPASSGGGSESSGSSGGGGGGNSGGGGGGGLLAKIQTNFSVSKNIIKISLKQGETKKETFTIKNIGTSIFDIKTYLDEIKKFKVSPEENEITTTLNPNEEKNIDIIFKALENEIPEIYPHKIRLKGPSVEKEITTIIEVDSAHPLFDVDVNVLPDTKKILAGEEIVMEINLFNVRGFGRVDVTVEYSIKDLQGNLLSTEHETLAVETEAKFTRKVLVPSNLRPGTYVAFVKVIYADSTGISSDVFEVQAKSIRLYPMQIGDYRVILLIVTVVIIGSVLIFSAHRFGYINKKMLKVKKKEDITKEIHTEEKAQKLGKELEAMEKAYNSGFISEESYLKNKKRIEDEINKFR